MNALLFLVATCIITLIAGGANIIQKYGSEEIYQKILAEAEPKRTDPFWGLSP